MPEPGDRARTLWKRRVVIAVAAVAGKVEFYFADEGPQPFHQRCALRTWEKWSRNA
jgi:hypothetical protein